MVEWEGAVVDACPPRSLALACHATKGSEWKQFGAICLEPQLWPDGARISVCGTRVLAENPPCNQCNRASSRGSSQPLPKPGSATGRDIQPSFLACLFSRGLRWRCSWYLMLFLPRWRSSCRYLYRGIRSSHCRFSRLSEEFCAKATALPVSLCIGSKDLVDSPVLCSPKA